MVVMQVAVMVPVTVMELEVQVLGEEKRTPSF